MKDSQRVSGLYGEEGLVSKVRRHADLVFLDFYRPVSGAFPEIEAEGELPLFCTFAAPADGSDYEATDDGDISDDQGEDDDDPKARTTFTRFGMVGCSLPLSNCRCPQMGGLSVSSAWRDLVWQPTSRAETAELHSIGRSSEAYRPWSGWDVPLSFSADLYHVIVKVRSLI
jgi:hypothetical protein